MLSKDTAQAIRNDDVKLKAAEVDASELRDGETVGVRELTAKERWLWGKFSTKAQDDPAMPDPMSYLLTMSAVDADGAKLWSAQDADWLQEKSGSFISRATDKIMELSGMAQSTDKALEDAGKGSVTTLKPDTRSDSDENSDAPSQS